MSKCQKVKNVNIPNFNNHEPIPHTHILTEKPHHLSILHTTGDFGSTGCDLEQHHPHQTALNGAKFPQKKHTAKLDTPNFTTAAFSPRSNPLHSPFAHTPSSPPSINSTAGNPHQFPNRSLAKYIFFNQPHN